VFCGRSSYSGSLGPSGGAGVILLVEDGSVVYILYATVHLGLVYLFIYKM
jgi:hypothetical protein